MTQHSYHVSHLHTLWLLYLLIKVHLLSNTVRIIASLKRFPPTHLRCSDKTFLSRIISFCEVQITSGFLITNEADAILRSLLGALMTKSSDIFVERVCTNLLLPKTTGLCHSSLSVTQGYLFFKANSQLSHVWLSVEPELSDLMNDDGPKECQVSHELYWWGCSTCPA